MRDTTLDRSALVRGRVAVCLLFLLSGMAIGTWTSRIPSIKQSLGLSDGQFGIALLGIAAGAICGMQAVGRLVDRHGSVRVMTPMAFAQAVVLVLPAWMPNLTGLAVALFLFGAVHGVLDVAMNANGVEVERVADRPMMSSFHAVFSVGGFLGSTGGGLLAHAAFGVAATFATGAAVMIALALWAARWALTVTPPSPVPSASPPPPGGDAPAGPKTIAAAAGDGAGKGGGARGGVLLLGVLAFCCMIGEGATADWSSVYLREDLGSSPGFAPAAYAAFSVMMTAGRLIGDRLAARIGPVTLVRACAALAASGLGLALPAGHEIAAVVGFGCFGAGLSCIVPQVFSAAGRRDPARAGRALARVASLGYAGFLAGPVLIGGVAELLGLPRALAVPALLALFVAVAAGTLRTAPLYKVDSL
ncbi:putative MFS family arabinose efflux permease [Streptosporangium becharense]|uniref:Putative MFS family arabinose efflux permease n=1 Tax=Streptosporangium becharense TaxID=1816182 RepID=A0A7W9IMN9_9ACTN|nr:MFS transporter [Streptosporangium becharense]MBB2914416.1 putative MFS family arabinose efflux permease [Streptosporangium becharense]MBB5823552.1 putative MFS family arabinose efflux permease [Streptosporangium becharense]